MYMTSVWMQESSHLRLGRRHVRRFCSQFGRWHVRGRFSPEESALFQGVVLFSLAFDEVHVHCEHCADDLPLRQCRTVTEDNVECRRLRYITEGQSAYARACLKHVHLFVLVRFVEVG
jgi:hypothetical protein